MPPGSWELYAVVDWLLLVASAGACASSQSFPICAVCEAVGLTREGIAHLDFSVAPLQCALVVTQQALPSLHWDHNSRSRKVECAGDILEAVGGIIHPRAKESRFTRTHLAGDDLTHNDVDDARALLGSLAQR